MLGACALPYGLQISVLVSLYIFLFVGMRARVVFYVLCCIATNLVSACCDVPHSYKRRSA